MIRDYDYARRRFLTGKLARKRITTAECWELMWMLELAEHHAVRLQDKVALLCIGIIRTSLLIQICNNSLNRMLRRMK